MIARRRVYPAIHTTRRGDALLLIEAKGDMRIDMCMDVCMDMSMGMRMHMRMHRRVHMRIDNVETRHLHEACPHTPTRTWQAAARHMVRQQRGGSLICMSSVHAVNPCPEWTVYGR